MPKTNLMIETKANKLPCPDGLEVVSKDECVKCTEYFNGLGTVKTVYMAPGGISMGSENREAVLCGCALQPVDREKYEGLCTSFYLYKAKGVIEISEKKSVPESEDVEDILQKSIHPAHRNQPD